MSDGDLIWILPFINTGTDAACQRIILRDVLLGQPLMEILLTPPIGFIIYSIIGFAIYQVGKKNSPVEDKTDDMKRRLYGSGEEAPEERGVPGFQPFLLISLFFALMHLGVLIIGMTTPNYTSIIYTIILMLGLLALILG